MAESSRERALRFLEGAHSSLSTFGQDSYGMHGRGVVRVSVPDLPLGVTSGIASTEMVYHALDELRRLLAGVQAVTRADADALLRMIETYDPTTQAVVMVGFKTGAPISVKMRLDSPFVVEAEEPAGD